MNFRKFQYTNAKFQINFNGSIFKVQTKDVYRIRILSDTVHIRYMLFFRVMPVHIGIS